MNLIESNQKIHILNSQINFINTNENRDRSANSSIKKND